VDATEMEHKYLRDTELFKNLSIPLRANITLREWRRLGITFLDFKRRKLGFAILADEMGVGKVGLAGSVILTNRLYNAWVQFIT